MNPPWRHRLRRARFAVTVLVAVVLIGAAVAVGLVQALLPLATHYPDFVASQLSARLHRPVKFSAITSQWQPSGPLLTVRDLTLGPGKPGGQSITLPHAALKFDFGAWLRPAHRWITLRVSGLELRVVRSAGGWRVDGFGNAAGQAHASLQSLPVDLDLRDLRVDVVDQVTQRSWPLFAPRLRVVNVGGAVRFGGLIRQRGTRQAATVIGRADGATRDYDLYLATHDLDLATAARGLDLHGFNVRTGRADVQAWGHWRRGKLVSVVTDYALRGLSLSAPGGRRAVVPQFAGVFSATRVVHGWNVAWRGPGKPRADIDQVGGVLAELRGAPGARQVSVAARDVDVAPWLSLLALLPRAPLAFADWVQRARPHAHINAAALQWREGGRYAATVRLSALDATAAGKLPGLKLAAATLRADNTAVALELPPQAATVALTDVFHKPCVFSKLGGSIVAWRATDGWRVAIPALHFEMAGLAGSAEARLAGLGHGQRPFLSAYVAVAHAKVQDAGYFWPYRSMPPSLIAWLNHALVAGEVTAGRVVLRGPLADYPFLAHEGRFEAAGHVQNATFNFSDAWPQATGVDADVDFVDNQMRIEASHVEARDVTVSHAVATIPDLGHGVLNLDIRGKDQGAALLDFVRHSPVGAGARDALAGMTLGGTGQFAINLSIPLDAADKFSLDGKVDLAKADVTAAKWNLVLKNLHGPLLIHGNGFAAKDLAATFRGAPATLALAVGSGVSNPADIVEASLAASISAQTLVQGYPDLDGLVAHARGVAPFQIGVRVAAAANGAAAKPTLTVQSSLAGIALDFPAPLDKPAAVALPLRLTLQLPPVGAPFTVALGDVLQVRGRLADAAHKLPLALAVNFGRALPDNVPPRGLVVGGHAARLDVSGWIQQALGGASAAGFPQLTRADVGTDAAQVFGTHLGPLDFDYVAGTDGDRIELAGKAVQGSVVLPPASALMTRGITARLQHLYWPEPPPAKAAVSVAPPAQTSPVAPTAIPPLHVTIGDLRLGNAHLGATAFESAPTAAGMHVAKFDSKGKDFAIQAHGDWDGTTAASHSHFVIDIASQDFGDTLAAFGFKGLLAGGRNTHIQIDGTWPGGPSAFSLGWMDGLVKMDVGEGRILAVQPGFGRMLGLLSVRELPSRLALRFGDVFKSGFGFDHATATLTFKQGDAFTDDMQIKAPAAQISMRGRVGFRARDFDLTVTAVPHLGATLPVVGAVVGGPVGAAAGLVVQGLLGKQINHAADNTYRVSGSWDKPKITAIAGRHGAAAAAAPAPAGSASGVPGGAVPASADSVGGRG